MNFDSLAGFSLKLKMLDSDPRFFTLTPKFVELAFLFLLLTKSLRKHSFSFMNTLNHFQTEFVQWTCPALNLELSIVRCGDIRMKKLSG